MPDKTSFEKLKNALIDIKDHYPDGIVYGKLECYFEGRRYVLDLLINQDIFELIPKNQIEKLPISDEEKNQRWYRLAKRGVDLAISMINLEYSEKVLNYSEKTNRLTDSIKFLTIVLTLIAIGNFLLAWLQIKILLG